jgi:hypothetical protein
MKLEEIKNKSNEAVSYRVAALESGQSDILTQYLNAMARFHNYSFGNIMLIAREGYAMHRRGLHKRSMHRRHGFAAILTMVAVRRAMH